LDIFKPFARFTVLCRKQQFCRETFTFFGIIWEEKYIILTILDIDAKLLGRIIITTSEYHP